MTGNIITVSLVGIVVDSAIQVSIALQLLGYTEGAVGAAEVDTIVAIVGAHRQTRYFDFRPDSSETFAASHFIRRCEPVQKNQEIAPFSLSLYQVMKIVL